MKNERSRWIIPVAIFLILLSLAVVFTRRYQHSVGAIQKHKLDNETQTIPAVHRNS